MKQNGIVQNQIIAMMQNLVECKILAQAVNQLNPQEVYIPNIKFKTKQIRDEFGFFESMIELTEKPKKIVEYAKYFVKKAKENGDEEYWNRAIYYYPKQTQFCEVGVIDYFEILFKKIYS